MNSQFKAVFSGGALIGLSIVPFCKSFYMELYSAPIQKLKLTTSQAVIYNEYKHRNTRTTKEIDNEMNLTRGQYNGELSYKTKRRITNKLNLWLQSLAFAQSKVKLPNNYRTRKPTFITLTLPTEQLHDDREIKRTALTPFISEIVKKYNVLHWFWIAETQKNGNIHFHLICDSYIPHQVIRETWNRNLAKLGYIKRFFAKHGHNNPNSTDVAGLATFTNAVKYVVKYVQKNTNCRPIKGRLNGMSSKLEKLVPFTTAIDSDTENLIDELLIDCNGNYHIEQFFTVIYVDTHKTMNRIQSTIRTEFEDYLKSIFEYLYLDSGEPIAGTRYFMNEVQLNFSPPAAITGPRSAPMQAEHGQWALFPTR